MKPQNTVDAFEILKIFQKDVLAKAPSPKEMVSEVRMMKFKIRPIQGDLVSLDFQNEEFISALWSLGKLDEFFQQHFPKLRRGQQEVFYRLMDEMRSQFQARLNRADIKPPAKKDNQSVFEMEIYKERSKKLN